MDREPGAGSERAVEVNVRGSGLWNLNIKGGKENAKRFHLGCA